MSDDSKKRAVSVIEEQADKAIRRSLLDGVWYFSVIDVIAVLTDSHTPRRYWAELKVKLRTEEFQLFGKIEQLKMQSRDGKRYNTDAADTETLLRIIQSVPSPKAEPIKQWLAKVGVRKLEETYFPTNLGSSIAEIRRNKPDDSDLTGMADYYQQLSMVYRQQALLESRLRFVEVATRSQGEEITDLKIRLDELERNQSSLPQVLQLLRVGQLTPAHQKRVNSWVNQLAKATGWRVTAIFADLAADFEYKTFGDARESDWKRIEEYFREKLERARRDM
jgi:hypothetical protein